VELPKSLKEDNMEWIETLVEEEYFPFYEFMWVCMLGLWWSVIVRLRNLQEELEEQRKIWLEILEYWDEQ
tara:strand:- start:4 stop:213 length:210 start_codon:yes stop_codon:yes gene_type:complete